MKEGLSSKDDYSFIGSSSWAELAAGNFSVSSKGLLTVWREWRGKLQSRRRALQFGANLKFALRAGRGLLGERNEADLCMQLRACAAPLSHDCVWQYVLWAIIKWVYNLLWPGFPSFVNVRTIELEGRSNERLRVENPRRGMKCSNAQHTKVLYSN